MPKMKESRCTAITKRGFNVSAIKCWGVIIFVCNIKKGVKKQKKSECAICYSEFYPNQLFKTQCNHSFCVPCMTEWVLVKPSCPMCRSVNIGCLSTCYKWAADNELVIPVNVTEISIQQMLFDYVDEPGKLPETNADFDDYLCELAEHYSGKIINKRFWDDFISPRLRKFTGADDLNKYYTKVYPRFMRKDDLKKFKSTEFVNILFV